MDKLTYNLRLVKQEENRMNNRNSTAQPEDKNLKVVG